MDENALHFCSTQEGKNEDIWMVFEGCLRSLLCCQILFHIRLISMSHQRQKVVMVMNKSRNTKFIIIYFFKCECGLYYNLCIIKIILITISVKNDDISIKFLISFEKGKIFFHIIYTLYHLNVDIIMHKFKYDHKL